MSIRSEALPFVLPPGLMAAAAAATGAVTFAVAAAACGLLLGAFFRDPSRRCGAPEEAIVSPADGVVVQAERQQHATRLAVFLAVWNVHIARSPVAGRLLACRHQPGRHWPAFTAAAADRNARCTMTIDTAWGPVRLDLISGVIARRVHAWVRPSQRLQRGERVGLIRFGSRAEVLLPAGAELAVAVGQRVRAGESVVARIVHREGGR